MGLGENPENRNSSGCDFNLFQGRAKLPWLATGALVPLLPKAGLRLGLENVMERGDGR